MHRRNMRMVHRRIFVVIALVCVMVLGSQSPASAGEAWLVYQPGGTTYAIGTGDGGSHVDGSYAFFVHKTTPAGLCAMTQAAYTGWPGWRDVAVYCGEGTTGYRTWVMNLGVTAVFMRVCLAFEDGVRGCTQAVPLYDDGRT